ncbi:MAG: hypothetical protein HFJ28_04635 [Clostridia bacterium]|jgi:hypothetical protein|nr:hypothetical protein [Clostridia bacterium]
MKQKNICIARVVKNIAYFIVPIFIAALMASIITLAIIDSDIKIQNVNSYYETEIFSDKYLSDIYSSYQSIQNVVNGTQIEEDDYYNGIILEFYMDSKEKEVSIAYNYNYINTNFYYLIVNMKDKTAITNVERTMKTDSVEEIEKEFRENTIYWNYNKRRY